MQKVGGCEKVGHGLEGDQTMRRSYRSARCFGRGRHGIWRQRGELQLAPVEDRLVRSCPLGQTLRGEVRKRVRHRGGERWAGGGDEKGSGDVGEEP